MSSFLKHYLRIVTEAIPAYFDDNHDADRFGPQIEGGKTIAARLLRRQLAGLGLVSAGAAKQTMLAGLGFVEPHLANLEWLYTHLGDAESRDILVSTTAFRALGPRKIKLPLNCPNHWHRLHAVKQLAEGAEQVDSGFMGWKLSKLDLTSLGFPVRMFGTPGGVLATFVEQQYRCETPDGPIACAPGDVVVDAGACWADTALYFAHLAGPKGIVASFEFLPENLELFQRNLSLNPDLAGRIQLHRHPVWSSGGERLSFVKNGPGTSVGTSQSSDEAMMVTTMAIDELITGGAVPRVDFIKMDVEGAETDALIGAEGVLRKFQPKLAITVYHKFSDFWTIPQSLDRLGAGYQFYLRHFTIHAEETVLFARVLDA